MLLLFYPTLFPVPAEGHCEKKIVPFGTLSLLKTISISEYADKFVLKGGVLLYIVLEEKARATKDIDMLARQLNNSLENVEAIFKSVCEIKEDDAIEFDLNTLTVEKIKEDADYEGVRVKV
ncbi:nucleotidyl transferase AbiEii/AbiGii toxin family protein, partial [Clostridium thermarum]|uniref:nucleotidyl transferase AbiEii/AbiGii toxin family protein n=1 Tax=Clostridium thermarum TaxID=1716543 RepID=UPI0013D0561E